MELGLAAQSAGRHERPDDRGLRPADVSWRQVCGSRSAQAPAGQHQLHRYQFGYPFGFPPQTFDVICSDLASCRFQEGCSVVSAATGTQISAYNLETVIAIEHTVDDLLGRLRQMRCRSGNTIMGIPCGDVAGKVSRVNLSDYAEPETRAHLLAVLTRLTLYRDQVDELVAAGQAMIRRNAAAIGRFLEPAPRAAVVPEGNNCDGDEDHLI